MARKSIIITALLLALMILPGFTCSYPEQTRQLENSIQLETENKLETSRKQDAIVLAIDDINERLDALPGDDQGRIALEAQITDLTEVANLLEIALDAEGISIKILETELELLKSAQSDPLGMVVDVAAPFVPAPWRELLAGVLSIATIVQTVRQRNAKAESEIRASELETAKSTVDIWRTSTFDSAQQFDRLVKNIAKARVDDDELNFKALGDMNDAAGIQDLVTKARPAKPAK